MCSNWIKFKAKVNLNAPLQFKHFRLQAAVSSKRIQAVNHLQLLMFNLMYILD